MDTFRKINLFIKKLSVPHLTGYGIPTSKTVRGNNVGTFGFRLSAFRRATRRSSLLVAGSWQLKARDGGFSLIELAITFFVMALLGTIIFPSLPRTREQNAMIRTGQEIALIFRDAEARALSVRATGTGTFPGYGVHINLSNRKELVLFPDLDGSKTMSGAEASDSVAITYTIEGPAHIENITSGGSPVISVLDVVYFRPDPTVTLRDGNGNPIPDTRVTILIATDRPGLARSVEVWTTGQVSISPTRSS